MIKKNKPIRLKGRKLKQLIGEVFLRDKFTCKYGKYCANYASPTIIDIHHIKYKSRGGEDSKDNLITLCRLCHDEVHKQNIKITKGHRDQCQFEIPETKILK